MALDGVDRYRAGWLAFGVGIALVLAFITYVFVGTVVFGLFLYYSTRPFHERIRPRLGQPTVSAIVALLVLVVPFVLLVAYAGAIALQEFSALASTVDLGPYQEIVDPYLNVSAVVDNPASILDSVGDPGRLLETATAALGYLGLVGSGLLYLFVSVTIAFYLLRDTRRLSGYAKLIEDDDGVLRAYGRAVDESLKKIYFGNILNAFLTGVIGAIGFSLVNVAAPEAFAIPYPALLGVLAGAGSLIPVVGMKIVYVPMLGYLGVRAGMAGTGWEFVAIAAAVSIVVVDFIPDLLLRPYVSGGDMHTGTVMFAYVLGPVIWGWYGLFLGPLLLVVGTHFARIVLPELLSGDPIRPDALEPAAVAVADASDAGDTVPDQPDDQTDETTVDGQDEETTDQEDVADAPE